MRTQACTTIHTDFKVMEMAHLQSPEHSILASTDQCLHVLPFQNSDGWNHPVCVKHSQQLIENPVFKMCYIPLASQVALNTTLPSPVLFVVDVRQTLSMSQPS